MRVDVIYFKKCLTNRRQLKPFSLNKSQSHKQHISINFSSRGNVCFVLCFEVSRSVMLMYDNWIWQNMAWVVFDGNVLTFYTKRYYIKMDMIAELSLHLNFTFQCCVHVSVKRFTFHPDALWRWLYSLNICYCLPKSQFTHTYIYIPKGRTTSYVT